MTGRCIIIHTLDHARAALSAARGLGVPVTLATASGASAYLGPGWLPQVAVLARQEFPETEADFILDCGERAGDVMAALRAGSRKLRFGGPDAVFEKLRQIAEAQDAEVIRDAPPALDLLDSDTPEKACRDWFAGN